MPNPAGRGAVPSEFFRQRDHRAASLLAASFLAVSVPIETAYSWRAGLIEPYYAAKVVGWLLLIAGVVHLRRNREGAGLGLLVAGWAWFGANFWRAVADRLSRITAGQSLPLGSIELWFAGSCLLISLIGLGWALTVVWLDESGRREAVKRDG